MCANLIVYGALGGLFYRYVLNPPPAPEIEFLPTPTLRPTFTPTWTPTTAPPALHAVTVTSTPSSQETGQQKEWKAGV